MKFILLLLLIPFPAIAVNSLDDACIVEIKKTLKNPDTFQAISSKSRKKADGTYLSIIEYIYLNGLGKETTTSTKCIVDSSGQASLLF